MWMSLKHVETQERMDQNININELININIWTNRQAPGMDMNFPPLLRQEASFIKSSSLCCDAREDLFLPFNEI